jgi:hypothetical protein
MLERRRDALAVLRETAPQRFVLESTKLADDRFFEELRSGAAALDVDPGGAVDDKTADARRPSHTNFLLAWRYAARLPSKEAAAAWLERNDPAGFWRASLLTFAAIRDRSLPPSGGFGFGGYEASFDLVRLPSGQPTAFALLAREYAKTHVIPPVQ